VKTGTAKRNEKDDKQLIVPVDEAMKPGDYQVDWHVVSVDGHKTKGKYHFSVK
jgi:methionine-rich copper-binding protein CopC